MGERSSQDHHASTLMEATSMTAGEGYLYYIFHVVYLGQPAQILHELWLAFERRQWKTLVESLKESYRAMGVMSSLIATAAAALLALQPSTEHTVIRTLLLLSLTCSLICATYSVAFLSTTSYSSPDYLEKAWTRSGLTFAISLSGPSAWLSHALWAFQAALLAFVWISEGLAARVILTTLISVRPVLSLWERIQVRGFKDGISELFIGRRDGMDHRYTSPTEDAVRLRVDYRQRIPELPGYPGARPTSPKSDITYPSSVKLPAWNTEIHFSDLPRHLQLEFDRTFIPHLHEEFGTMKPWAPPPRDVLETSWEYAFPDEPFAAVSAWHVQVIEKLVEDRMATWRNEFAKTALSYLQDVIFSQRPSQDERATWCKWAISGTNDLHHPFYYLKYKSKELASGIFQSPLISVVLAAHLAGVPHSCVHDPTKRPTGALVHAIQAVKRAILMWRTGRLLPPGPQDDYSKSNWGDRIEVREGRQVRIKTTSTILKLVNKLKPKQWEKILNSALEFCEAKNEVVTHEGSIEVDSGSDFEVLDNDDDLNEDM